MAFWTCLLKCRDGSYYVGHTDDLERRVAQHQTGELPGYTHSRRPIELMHASKFVTREEALAMELRIKGWSRSKKEALAREDWKAINRLSRGRHRHQR